MEAQRGRRKVRRTHTHKYTRVARRHGHKSNRQEGGRECQGGERAGPGGTRRPFTNLARANVLTVGCCAYAPAPHHRPVYEAPLPGDYTSRQVPCSAWYAGRAPPPERRVGGPLPNPTLRRTHHRIGCGVCCRGERAARRLSLERPAARAPDERGALGLAYEVQGRRAVPRLE